MAAMSVTNQQFESKMVCHSTTRFIVTLVTFVASGIFIRIMNTPHYEELSRSFTNPAQKATFEVAANNQLLKEVFTGALVGAFVMYSGLYLLSLVERRLWQQVDRQIHQD